MPDQSLLLKKIEAEQDQALATGQSASDRIEKDLQEAQNEFEHPRYKPIRVRYDKNNPADSVLDPDVLQSDKSQLYTSMVLIILGGVLLGGTYLQSYMLAPTPDDPSLSLEAALAAQKRRRY